MSQVCMWFGRVGLGGGHVGGRVGASMRNAWRSLRLGAKRGERTCLPRPMPNGSLCVPNALALVRMGLGVLVAASLLELPGVDVLATQCVAAGGWLFHDGHASLRWWMVGLLSEGRRALFWRVMCTECDAQGAALTHRQVHVERMSWLHLRGHPGAWALTDGYGWRSWSCAPEDVKVRHAARRLGVEGGRDFWHANAAFDANPGQKKWIPPPMKVWIQKETFNATSHPVLDAELSSVSTGW